LYFGINVTLQPRQLGQLSHRDIPPPPPLPPPSSILLLIILSLPLSLPASLLPSHLPFSEKTEAQWPWTDTLLPTFSQ